MRATPRYLPLLCNLSMARAVKQQKSSYSRLTLLDLGLPYLHELSDQESSLYVNLDYNCPVVLNSN
jgi:hypothetical protein